MKVQEELNVSKSDHLILVEIVFKNGGKTSGQWPHRRSQLAKLLKQKRKDVPSKFNNFIRGGEICSGEHNAESGRLYPTPDVYICSIVHSIWRSSISWRQAFQTIRRKCQHICCSHQSCGHTFKVTWFMHHIQLTDGESFRFYLIYSKWIVCNFPDLCKKKAVDETWGIGELPADCWGQGQQTSLEATAGAATSSLQVLGIV